MRLQDTLLSEATQKVIPSRLMVLDETQEEGGSEEVSVGAHDLEDRSTDEVERSLSSVQYESKGKS